MRKTAGFVLLAAMFLAGCRAQPEITEPPETVAPSVEVSIGAGVPADDPALAHVDSEGGQPADILLELIDAINSADFELAYSLYGNPEADFDDFKSDREESQESYQDFTVHETRVIGPGSAIVRVTYNAETTPPGGERYPIHIEEPGEWWRVEMVDGVWRVGWLPRQ